MLAKACLLALTTLLPLCATAQKTKDKVPGTVPLEQYAAALEFPREQMLEAVKATMFPAGIKVPEPGLEVIEVVDEGDYERRKVRFVVDEGETATGYLLVPKPLPQPGQKLPLVVALHPTAYNGKDRVIDRHERPAKNKAEQIKREDRAYALDMLKAGFIVFAPDRAAFGERRLLPTGPGTDLPDEESYTATKAQMEASTQQLKERYPNWGLAGKAVWDVQRGLDALQTLDFIDMNKVAAIGLSLGAWDSVLLGAVDDRVGALVISHTGNLVFKPELWSNQAALAAYVERAGKRGRPALNLDFNLYLMLFGAKPQLYSWSIEDRRDIPPNMVDSLRLISNYSRAVATREGKPFNFNFHLHPHGHTFPVEARALSAAWLKNLFEQE